MAGETSKRVVPTWATAAGVMLFKVPTGHTYTLSEISIGNTDTTQRLVSLYHVPDGESYEPLYMFFPGVGIKAGQIIEGARGKIFEEGDELWIQADEDDLVNVGCSYIDEEL